MIPDEIPERLRKAIADAIAYTSRVESECASRASLVHPGEVYLFRAESSEIILWCTVLRHPDEERLLYTVPANNCPLIGVPDVSLPEDSPCAPLSIRCGLGLWLHDTFFQTARRVGILDTTSLELVQERLAELASGQLEGTVLQLDEEVDPEYEEQQSRIAAELNWLESRSVSFGPPELQDDASLLPFSPPENLRVRRGKVVAEYRAQRLRPAAASGSSARIRDLLVGLECDAYEVEGDPRIRLKLMVHHDQTGRLVGLSLWLVPFTGELSLDEIAQRYVNARVTVPGLDPPIDIPLRRAGGTFTPLPEIADRYEDWIVGIGIELIDAQGESHRVELGTE